jgi:hypothetical protein
MLLQVFGELVRVFHTLYITAGAWIAIPVPGATDAITGLNNLHIQSCATQAMEHKHTGESSTDYHRINLSWF